MSAPVGYTCPSIDRAKDATEEALDDLESQLSSQKEEALGKIHTLFEELRSDNESLRDWGNKNEALLEEKEEEITLLERRIQELEEEVENLQEALNEKEE